MFADFDLHAGQIGGALAYLGDDGVGRRALVPLGELELHGADDVFRLFLHLLAAAGTRVDGLYAGRTHHPALDLAHQRILLHDGQVAARMHLDDRAIRVDVGEELDPRPNRA